MKLSKSIRLSVTEDEYKLIEALSLKRKLSMSKMTRAFFLRGLQSSDPELVADSLGTPQELDAVGGDNIKPGLHYLTTQEEHQQLKAVVDDLDRRLGEIARLSDAQFEDLMERVKRLEAKD